MSFMSFIILISVWSVFITFKSTVVLMNSFILSSIVSTVQSAVELISSMMMFGLILKFFERFSYWNDMSIQFEMMDVMCCLGSHWVLFILFSFYGFFYLFPLCRPLNMFLSASDDNKENFLALSRFMEMIKNKSLNVWPECKLAFDLFPSFSQNVSNIIFFIFSNELLINYFIISWFMKASFILIYIFVSCWIFFTSSLWLLYFGLELQWMLLIIFFIVGGSIWKGLINYVMFNELVGTLLMLGLVLHINIFFHSLYYGKMGFYPFMMPMVNMVLNVSYLYFLFDPMNKFLYFISFIAFTSSSGSGSYPESLFFTLLMMNFFMMYVYGISFTHSIKVILFISSLINFLLIIILMINAEVFLFSMVYFIIYYFTLAFFLSSMILFFNNCSPPFGKYKTVPSDFMGPLLPDYYSMLHGETSNGSVFSYILIKSTEYVDEMIVAKFGGLGQSAWVAHQLEESESLSASCNNWILQYDRFYKGFMWSCKYDSVCACKCLNATHFNPFTDLENMVSERLAKLDKEGNEHC